VSRIVYDGFGNVVSGDDGSSLGGDFRFQGQWLEGESGLYYMRARDYDAQTGLFLSRDPVDMQQQGVEAFNPYQFAYDNPLIYSDPTGLFTLADVNAAQNIQNILLQQAYNTIRQDLINRAQGVVTNILMSTLQTLLVPRGEIWQGLQDILGTNRESQRGGRTWERLVTDAVCDIILGNYTQHTQDLWVQPTVNTNGTPTSDGFNCGGYTYTLRNRVISTRGLPQGPRPDFIIKRGGPFTEDPARQPANSNFRKAYLIGDFKTSWNAVYNGLGKNQWRAIMGYANTSRKHQIIPVALYVTAIGGTEVQHQRIFERSIRKGVFVYLLTLFPFIRRGI
jgi:RHS repeat-associated protein